MFRSFHCEQVPEKIVKTMAVATEGKQQQLLYKPSDVQGATL